MEPRSRSRRLRLPLLLAFLVGFLFTGSGTAQADPVKCVEVYDAQGQLITEVCVPWPLAP